MAGHVVYPMDHPLMRDAVRIRGHALAALAHAAASMESLRRMIVHGDEPGLHERQMVLRSAMYGLGLRYGDLADLYSELTADGRSGLTVRSKRFFNRYDDFLEALRRARSDIACMEAACQRAGPSAPSESVDRPAAGGGSVEVD